MSVLYLIHVSCALISITGFALRGYWMLTGNPALLSRPAKTIPHVVDTLLLLSAVAMLMQWGLWPTEQAWLMAKIIALLAYIGLGMVALRFGSTPQQKAGAYAMALLTAGYIVSVALTKSPWGIVQLLRL
jgi:uncharacterized membrane protein SirB2